MALAHQGATGNFLELALISCLPDSDLVHFTWYHGDDSAVCEEIERLVKESWIPLAMMGIDEDGRLLAQPLREHARGNGIKWYLRKVMDQAARIHNEGPEPLSNTTH